MLIITADELPRVVECNGSINMPRAYPTAGDDLTARDEGTAAHWMAQQAFRGVPIADLIDVKAPNGFMTNAEMAEHVELYLTAIGCGIMEVMTSFKGHDYQVNGRADHILALYHPNDQHQTQCKELIIDDFKYGWTLIDPEMNWTLIAHAIGYSLNNLCHWADEYVFRIHQPRPYHPDGKLREWRITGEQLRQLHQRLDMTLNNPANELRTGLSWCRRCHALATCPAARSASMNAIDATTLAFSDELNNETVSFELDTLRNAQAMLSSRLSALEEMATHRIKFGGVIPNYAVEPQYAHTRFKSGFTGSILTAMTGIDCRKDSTITPAEFKRRGGSQKVYDATTERPLTGVKLVRASADQRAQRIFKRS